MFNPDLICGETLLVFLRGEENLYPLIAERHGVQQNTQIATFIKKFILGGRIWDNILGEQSTRLRPENTFIFFQIFYLKDTHPGMSCCLLQAAHIYNILMLMSKSILHQYVRNLSNVCLIVYLK